MSLMHILRTDGVNSRYYCHSPSTAPGKPKIPSPTISFSVNRVSGPKPTPISRVVSGMKNWFAAVAAGGTVVGTVGLGYTALGAEF